MTLPTPDTHAWDVIEIVLPIGGSVLALISLAALHRAARMLRWRARKTRETEWAERPEFQLPPHVQRPEEHAGVSRIHDAQHAELKNLPASQARFYAKGTAVALMPPMALLVLAGQVVFFSEGGSLALGLALGETLLLSCLLALAWSALEPSVHWVTARVRAELLRREQYLRLARVGPYRGLDADQATEVSERRVGDIQGTYELRELSRLVSDASFASHEEQPSPGFPSSFASVEDLLNAAVTYTYYRVRKQRLWFGLARSDCNRDERILSVGLKLALVGGVIAGLAHGLLLGWSEHWPHQIALAGAMTLPAVSGSFAGLANLYRFDLRGAFYGRQYEELSRMEQELHALLSGIRKASHQELARETARFHQLATRTERSLTRELEEWIAYTYAREYRLG